MPCNLTTVTRIALALPEVEQGEYFNTPAFYLRRKLMLRMWEDGETLVVKVDPADRPSYLAQAPDIYFLTDHYRNYPTMLVNLLSIHEDTLQRVIEGAWRFLAPKRLLSAYDQRPR